MKHHLILLPILLAAAALRFYGQDWDNGHHLHPDERFMAIVAAKIKLPDSIGEYFDTAGSALNPYNNDFDRFAYGTLPLFLARWLAEVLGYAGYDRIVYLGRTLSALADLGTVVFVYALASLLYGRRAAAIAATLAGLAVLNIQLSHFFTVDTFLTFFVAWSLYFAHRAWMHGGLLNPALLGLGVGLATACKISALLLGPVAVLVCLLPWPARPDGGGEPWAHAPPRGVRAPQALRTVRPHATRAHATALFTTALAALLAYRLAEPYAFLSSNLLDFRPNPQFVSDMLYWVRISSGDIEVPYMVQWAGTSRYVFAVEGLIRWGLGPAAGLAGLLGLLVAAMRLPAWGRHGSHLLLVVWAALNLLYFGGQFAKFMRYLLPIYPALAVLGGFFVAACWEAAGRWWSRPELMNRWAARLAACVPPLVLIPTALWALAFVGLYAEPNTRLAASRWLLQHAADGSVLAVEHWDDSLPLAIPGRERKGFRELSMNLYDDETTEKRRKLLDNLQNADYLILASNRLYGSIPRLPERYPLATEYYRALFDGRLGYQQVAEFTARPRLFGIEIDDDQAQEDFTVYDHPKVQIFYRRDDYDPRSVVATLGAVSLDNVQRVKPSEAGGRRLPLLTSNEWAAAQDSGTWSALFDPNDLANRYPVLVWWLAASLMALLGWPILWRLAPHLADRGYGLARVFGLLLVAYGAWLLASLRLVPFGRGSLLLGFVALAVASALALRGRWQQLGSYVRSCWPALAGGELAFTLGFALCLGMRLVNPDLWHPTFGGEKPMDFAYLNAVIKSDYFPPYDPWFAGGSINYYYFGFVLVATLVKLTGILPANAFNLALALWFGLLCQATFSVAYNFFLLRPGSPVRIRKVALAAGGLAVVLVALAGNLDAVVQLRDALWKASGVTFQSGIPLLAGAARAVGGLVALARGGGTLDFDFWRSTRLIGPEDPGPIHEFPFFSFLYGDLHAHLLALPFTLLVLGLTLELLRSRRLRGLLSGPLNRDWPPAGELARFALLLALLGLSLGALRATNTWDFPTYLAVVALGLACLLRPLQRAQALTSVAVVLGCGAIVATSSSIFFSPFIERYQLFYGGLEAGKARTAVHQFLLINGFGLFILASALLFRLGRRMQQSEISTLKSDIPHYGLALPMPVPRSTEWGWPGGFVAVALLGFALTMVGLGTLAVIMALLIGLVVLVWLRWRSSETIFAAGLAALALLLLGVPEIVALKGDVGRMNTVFKFYYQSWVLLGLVGALWLVRLVARRPRLWPCSSSWHRIWLAGAVALLAAVLVYPLLGTPVKLSARFGPSSAGSLTLDGMAFMQSAAYRDRDRDAQLPGDYAALRWMQEHVPGSPVVLEANTGLYKWGSRVSIYTGLPTVVGWDWHQKQQRVAMAGAVDQRLRDVRTIYESSTMEPVLPLLRRYGVKYVYVGPLERIYYSPGGLQKFERPPSEVLELVYQAEGVAIYRLADSSIDQE